MLLSTKGFVLCLSKRSASRKLPSPSPPVPCRRVNVLLCRYLLGSQQTANRTRATAVIFINRHSVSASYSSGKTGFPAKEKKCVVTARLFWISNIWPLKIHNLNGLVVRGGVGGHGGDITIILGPLLGKWNDSVFSSTMTAEHCVDYCVTGAKSW